MTINLSHNSMAWLKSLSVRTGLADAAGLARASPVTWHAVGGEMTYDGLTHVGHLEVSWQRSGCFFTWFLIL